VPVISAIHGHCIGGGTELALATDIRVASPDARISLREIHWGITLDNGGTITLPSVVGHDVAKLLTMTGRLVDGTEARGALRAGSSEADVAHESGAVSAALSWIGLPGAAGVAGVDADRSRCASGWWVLGWVGSPPGRGLAGR
jgi:enoyl-CoA hydratase/carnithine racemase